MVPTITNRLFLSWDDMACRLVAKQLIARGHADPDQPSAIVVPTREAARLLREQLAILSSPAAFLSPRIMPLSQLMRKASPSISSGGELYLWHQVLQEHGPQQRHLYPQGQKFSPENWLREAKQTIELLHQLALEGVDADSPAWHELASNDKRWAELAELQTLTRKHINARGLIDNTQELSCSLAAGTRIILACVPQVPNCVRKMLQAGSYPLEIWIHAPADKDHAFNAWGCPTEAWLTPCTADELGLNRSDWREHYCQAADLWKMAELAGQRAAAINASHPTEHQIALAVCDAEMEPIIEDELCHHGAKVYRPQGQAFTLSAWHQLLRELLSIIDALALSGLPPHSAVENYPAPVLIRLLKWPNLHRILQSPVTDIRHLAEALDEAQFKGIPVYESSLQRQLHQQESEHTSILRHVGEALHHALSCPSQLLLCLEQWVLQSSPRDPQQAKLDAFFLQQIQQLSPFVKDEQSSCRDILLLLQLLCQSHSTAHIRQDMSLDLLGWMELSYCPARHLIITGMHNGIIPETRASKALLNSATAKALGLSSDENRAARDAFLLRSIVASRGMGHTYFYFTLYDGKQNPLSPSSLLLRLCPDSHLASFASHFFDEQDKLARSPILKADTEGWYFKALSPDKVEQSLPVEQISCKQLGIKNPMEGKHFSPSSLKLFLQCPLRFWLSKIHKLNSTKVEEDKQNLNSQELGTFLHAVLEKFIRRYPSQAALFTAGKQGQEEAELLQIFEKMYQSKFGKKALLPQVLQREGMIKRLLAYLPLHQKLWDEGWECATDRDGKLMLEYQVDWQLGPHQVKMVIDRVDQRRREDGSYEYRILDYKTGKIDNCCKEHLAELKDSYAMQAYFMHKLPPVYTPFARANAKACRWVNVQLPLYAAWLKQYMPSCDMSVGYIHLARKSDEVKLMLWQSPDEKQGLLSPLESEKNAESIETLLDSAMQWVMDCMNLISQGLCFIPAEQLNWPIKQDYLFDELSQLQSIEKLFISPPTV